MMLRAAFWAATAEALRAKSAAVTNRIDTRAGLGAESHGCKCLFGPFKDTYECECCQRESHCKSDTECTWKGFFTLHKRSLLTACYAKHYPTVTDQEIRDSMKEGKNPWGCNGTAFGHGGVTHHCYFCSHLNGSKGDSCVEHIGCFWKPESKTSHAIIGHKCLTRHVVLDSDLHNGNETDTAFSRDAPVSSHASSS